MCQMDVPSASPIANELAAAIAVIGLSFRSVSSLILDTP
jgi:hypothetical protein